MSTSPTEIAIARGQAVTVTDDALVVDIADGRILGVPLAWYPRLLHATPAERAQWRWIGAGQGIHRRALDEDVSIEALLLGRTPGESQTSLQRWPAHRSASGAASQ